MDILQQFNSRNNGNDFIFGKVIAVGAAGNFDVETTSGLQVTLTDTTREYFVGDQVIMAARSGNLNGLFVIRKIDKAFPAAANIVIGAGQG